MTTKQIIIKVLRNIDNEIIDKIEDAYFPPIVESYPELNADSLPIEEQRKAYRALKDSFESLKQNKSSHKYLEECMCYNERTFIWFCTFFKKLEGQMSKKSNYLIPYNLTPPNKDKNFLFFQYPMYVSELQGKFIAHYIKYKGERLNNDIIKKHRAELISKRLEYTDFKNGFPNWYVLPNVVFEKYSSKINKRAKLLYNGKGEFEYYISGASDNWEQVYNVPLEIDDIIACILFQD